MLNTAKKIAVKPSRRLYPLASRPTADALKAAAAADALKAALTDTAAARAVLVYQYSVHAAALECRADRAALDKVHAARRAALVKRRPDAAPSDYIPVGDGWTDAERRLKKDHAAHGGAAVTRTVSPIQALAYRAAVRGVKTALQRNGSDDMRRAYNALIAYRADAHDVHAATSSIAADLTSAAVLAICERAAVLYVDCDARKMEILAMQVSDALKYRLARRLATLGTLEAHAAAAGTDDDADDADGMPAALSDTWRAALKAVNKYIHSSRAVHGRAKTSTTTRKEPPCDIIAADGTRRVYTSGRDVVIASRTSYAITCESLHSNAAAAAAAESKAAADVYDDVAAWDFLEGAIDRADVKPVYKSIARAVWCDGVDVADAAAAAKKSLATAYRGLSAVRAALATVYRAAGYDIAD